MVVESFDVERGSPGSRREKLRAEPPNDVRLRLLRRPPIRKGYFRMWFTKVQSGLVAETTHCRSLFQFSLSTSLAHKVPMTTWICTESTT